MFFAQTDYCEEDGIRSYLNRKAFIFNLILVIIGFIQRVVHVTLARAATGLNEL